MKRLGKYILCILVVLVLVMPVAVSRNYTQAATKKPAFNKTKVTFNGLEDTFTLQVKNRPANTKLTWSSSNKKVATINSLGQITPMNKGTTNIICKITYSDKTTMDLMCSVTVKIPATAVKISNVKPVDNVHHIMIDETYDFNRTLTPKNSSFKSYWVIEDTDIATVDSQGVVTGIKKGWTTLYVRSGATKKEAMDPTNPIIDSQIIAVDEIVATVKETKKVDDKTISIEFSEAMNKDSFVTLAGGLVTNNVYIDRKTYNDVLAADLGAITASLSSDGLILTLKSKNDWDGVYGIRIENDIMSKSGHSFTGYNTEIDCRDLTQPGIAGYRVDDTGMIGLIQFNKPVDISELGVNVSTSTQVLDSYTISILSNKQNYTLTADKMTLQVNMSGIASSDYNKSFTINLSGIKDLKGNWTNPYNNEVHLYTDTSLKPNAVIKDVKRTSAYTVTVYYDKAIYYPGTMVLNSTICMGQVNLSDKTCVDYRLDTTLAQHMGVVTGYVYGWMSYNSQSTGTSTNISVNMGVGATKPKIINTELVSTQNNGSIVHSIILTYDKKVELLLSSGGFNVTYSDAQSNVRPSYLDYTASVNDNVVTLMLTSSYLMSGTYTIRIPSGFVIDEYRNFSDDYTFQISTNEIASTKLPAPKEIVQNTNNPSEVFVYFNQKLDMTTASNTNNYSIDGIHPYSAYIQTNLDTGATVQLTFSPGAIKGKAPVKVENIKGYSGSYGVMNPYSILIELKENQPPKLLSAVYTGDKIELTFDELILGSASFGVYNYGTPVSISTQHIQSNKVLISLQGFNKSDSLYLVPQSGCEIKDLNNNRYQVPSQILVRMN